MTSENVIVLATNKAFTLPENLAAANIGKVLASHGCILVINESLLINVPNILKAAVHSFERYHGKYVLYWEPKSSIPVENLIIAIGDLSLPEKLEDVKSRLNSTDGNARFPIIVVQGEGKILDDLLIKYPGKIIKTESFEHANILIKEEIGSIGGE